MGAAAGTVTSANSASSLHLLRRPRPASAYSVDTSPIYLSPQRDTRHKPSAQIAAHAHLYRNNKLPFDSSVTMQETATLPAGPLQTPVSRFIKRARFDLQISLLQAPIDKQHTDSHLAEDIVRADLQTLPQFELGLQAGSLDLSHSRRSSNDSHSTASSDTLVSKPLEHKVVLAFTYGCHRGKLWWYMHTQICTCIRTQLTCRSTSTTPISSGYRWCRHWTCQQPIHISNDQIRL